ncbi:MAG: hypothetical protein PF488_01325 [Patescibacteria group bacterium]|jgi:hypothetical protein|nr:hypothetical protein [Patescibacteria group bacterium]
MNWTVFLIALIINSLLCLTQYLFEQRDRVKGIIEPRHSIIPGSDNQKILYWEDFYTQAYGDFLGLVWIMNCFFHLWATGQLGLVDILILIIFGFGSVYMFIINKIDPKSKPDWGKTLSGKLTIGGMIHFPYFALLSGMSAVCIFNILLGNVTGLLLILTLLGGIIYGITFSLDITSGNFDSLKKAKPKNQIL